VLTDNEAADDSYTSVACQMPQETNVFPPLPPLSCTTSRAELAGIYTGLDAKVTRIQTFQCVLTPKTSETPPQHHLPRDALRYLTSKIRTRPHSRTSSTNSGKLEAHSGSLAHSLAPFVADGLSPSMSYSVLLRPFRLNT
jgi:hypothetical protein